MIPFKAALFDLDGTLLDSMDVWHRVDENFFRSRGMDVPEDYGRKLAGKSYRESAEYTVENYLPDERWEDLVNEWTCLCGSEYAERVQLKPGALAYLRALRREGIKLAVTTALLPELYEPCLEHLGITELFDALCSTEHTDGVGKEDGRVFLLAAEKLGVKPEDCAVFEDVLTAVRSAKDAGMRVYGVRDPHGKKDHEAMAAVADGMIDTWDEMFALHGHPDRKRCVIFTAFCEGEKRGLYTRAPGDLVLCADGGWRVAEEMGITPDLVIGDFDSSERPAVGCVETHPVMKDDTDTMLCIRRALRMGYDELLIIGGFGGRFDHTMANIQSLSYIASHGARAEMRDGNIRAFILGGGDSVTLERRPGKLSLFSLTNECSGIDLTGTVWPLSNATLTNTFPLGVSNEFSSDTARAALREGILLILQTKD